MLKTTIQTVYFFSHCGEKETEIVESLCYLWAPLSFTVSFLPKRNCSKLFNKFIKKVAVTLQTLPHLIYSAAKRFKNNTKFHISASFLDLITVGVPVHELRERVHHFVSYTFPYHHIVKDLQEIVIKIEKSFLIPSYHKGLCT